MRRDDRRCPSTFVLSALLAAFLAFGCQSRPETSPESAPSPGPDYETGRLSVDQDWQTVDLKQVFVDPVVVAKPASLGGADPTTIRLREVQAGSFEIRLQEWAYLNGSHSAEAMSYLAIERGRRSLPGGGAVEAGSLETGNSRPGADPFVSVSFSEPFAEAPLVLSIVSGTGETAVVTRHQNVSTGGFEVILQEEEVSDGEHGVETIYWIAWQPGGSSEAGEVSFEAGIQKGVTHEFTAIAFSATLSATPCFLADMQTFKGDDPANLRYRNLTASGVEVQVAEEKSHDRETRHGPEDVGWVAFDCGK